MKCKKITIQLWNFSLIALLVCLLFLAGTTLAWYEEVVNNIGNSISATTFDLEIDMSLLTDEEEQPIQDFTIPLNVGTYNVDIKKSDEVLTNGFCLITITFQETELSKRYYTLVNDVISFNLILDETAVITFSPHWGTFGDYHDIYSEYLPLTVVLDNQGVLSLGTLSTEN